jgi:hypothetical protein
LPQENAYDRGESWCTVANNLPPIYSVRFARS